MDRVPAGRRRPADARPLTTMTPHATRTAAAATRPKSPSKSRAGGKGRGARPDRHAEWWSVIVERALRARLRDCPPAGQEGWTTEALRYAFPEWAPIFVGRLDDFALARELELAGFARSNCGRFWQADG